VPRSRRALAPRSGLRPGRDDRSSDADLRRASAIALDRRCFVQERPSAPAPRRAGARRRSRSGSCRSHARAGQTQFHDRDRSARTTSPRRTLGGTSASSPRVECDLTPHRSSSTARRLRCDQRFSLPCRGCRGGHPRTYAAASNSLDAGWTIAHDADVDR
jgi:hypothetical protein